jgi:hypothetical protein
MKRAKPEKPRLTYRSLEEDPSYEHPIDKTVRIRVGRRDLQRTVVKTTDAIVKALGKRRRLWFDFETAADKMRSLREAAYFDAGVEYGIAAARLHGLSGASKTVRALADRVLRELLATSVGHEDAARAAVAAAWALVGARTSVPMRRTAR